MAEFVQGTPDDQLRSTVRQLPIEHLLFDDIEDALKKNGWALEVVMAFSDQLATYKWRLKNQPSDGRRSDLPADSQARPSQSEGAVLAERRRLAEAGGELLTSAFRFLGEMLPDAPESPAMRVAKERMRDGLRACTGQGSNGEVELRVTLSPDALDGLAATLARILESRRPGHLTCADPNPPRRALLSSP